MSFSQAHKRANRRTHAVAQITTGYDTSDFDRNFWASVTSEERLNAGWELAVQAHQHRAAQKDKGNANELRLQRSFALLTYGPR
jgi:hypothetical protein